MPLPPLDVADVKRRLIAACMVWYTAACHCASLPFLCRKCDDDDDVTRSDQPKPPAVAIVRQNGLSSASCRASVAVTPVT